MAIDYYPGTGPDSSSRKSSGERASPSEPECCQVNDRHRTLVLTQLDGSVVSFPLTWIYRWQRPRDATHEVLTVALTEHQVTVHGHHLDRVSDQLCNLRGLHLYAKDNRYLSVTSKDSIRISAITITPHPRSPEPTD
jgi:hypothetical protein